MKVTVLKIFWDILLGCEIPLCLCGESSGIIIHPLWRLYGWMHILALGIKLCNCYKVGDATELCITWCNMSRKINVVYPESLQSTCIHMKEASVIGLQHCSRHHSFLIISLEFWVVKWIFFSLRLKANFTDTRQAKHTSTLVEFLWITELLLALNSDLHISFLIYMPLSQCEKVDLSLGSLLEELLAVKSAMGEAAVQTSPNSLKKQ